MDVLVQSLRYLLNVYLLLAVVTLTCCPFPKGHRRPGTAWWSARTEHVNTVTAKVNDEFPAGQPRDCHQVSVDMAGHGLSHLKYDEKIGSTHTRTQHVTVETASSQRPQGADHPPSSTTPPPPVGRGQQYSQTKFMSNSALALIWTPL